MGLKLTISNDTEFKTTIAEGLTLVDFWAPWCAPCKMQLAILEDLVGEIKGKVKIAKVNIDEVVNVSGQFDVQAIPTLILFKKGQEVQRFIGVQTKETLMDAFRAL